MRSVVSDEFAKYLALQICLRTKAMTYEKVASGFLYHAHFRIGMVESLSILIATRTTIENNPKRAGVLLAIALSDHWRCVSIPKCALSSSKVTSMFQRSMNQRSICSSPCLQICTEKGFCAQLTLRVANHYTI